MADDDVVLSLRARGAKKAAHDVRSVERSVAGLSKQARGAGRDAVRAGAGMRVLGAGARTAGAGMRIAAGNARELAGGALSSIASKSKYAAAGVALLGAAAAKTGVGFNAQFQDAETSFSTFLGSRDKARAFMEDLRGLNESPFRLTELMEGSRMLLGFEMSAERVKRTMAGLSTATIASGGNVENIKRATLALGQMQAVGTASAEELRQITEAGYSVNPILRRELKLTGKEVKNIGELGISSTKVIDALLAGWDEKYGKAAENARGNWTIQLAKGRKDVEQIQRLATKPLFGWLNRKAMPPALRALDDMVDTFKRDDIDMAEKLTLSRATVRRRLGPLAREVETEVDKLRLGERALAGFEQAVPAVANALAAAGPAVAKAFYNAFMDAGPWGKALMAGTLSMKLLGGGNWGIRGPVGAGSSSNPIAVVGLGLPGGKPPGGRKPPPAGGARGARDKTKGKGGRGGRLAKYGSKAAKVAKFGGPLAAVGVAADALVNADSVSATNDRPVSEIVARNRRARLARERERRMARRPRVARPPASKEYRTRVIKVMVDRRTLAEVVDREHADRGARR